MICKPKPYQKYDSWLHWNITSQCNLNCDYCFGKTPFVKQAINSIDIKKIVSTLNKTGKIFRISFTGGEPFLIPNIVEACTAITQKHFVSFNSNLTLINVKKFTGSISPERVLLIHASIHMDELKSKKLIERFCNNFYLFRERGFPIFAEQVAHPSILPELNENINFWKQKGIDINFGPFIGYFHGKRYPEAYTENDLKLFGIAKEQLKWFKQKDSICNAGFNAAVIYPSGNIHPCFQVKEKMGNIYSDIKFSSKTTICPSHNCDCPINKYDPYLFNSSIVLSI